MSSNDKNTVHHSQPIAISTQHSRNQSSASPASPLPTPATGIPPRIVPLSSSTSPILSYFLAQPPKSSAATFPFRQNFGAPVTEDDDEADTEHSPTRHARRSSMAWTSSERYPQSPAVVPAHQQDRAAGLLRRLSLGGTRPQLSNQKANGGNTGAETAQRSEAPPNSPVAGMPRKARRLPFGSPHICNGPS
ncbi:hypothetical protein B0H21DRAFT_745389 [Amylocystis lapponica]|nr:hypothetical protein B0H21DRAFT_745389 [Amylocystis lapponica]